MYLFVKIIRLTIKTSNLIYIVMENDKKSGGRVLKLLKYCWFIQYALNAAVNFIWILNVEIVNGINPKQHWVIIKKVVIFKCINSNWTTIVCAMKVRYASFGPNPRRIVEFSFHPFGAHFHNAFNSDYTNRMRFL